jgi:hypothetical protein
MKFTSPYQALHKRQSLIYRELLRAAANSKRFPNKNTQWKID